VVVTKPWEWFGSVTVAVVLQARFTAKGDGGEAHNAYSLQPCTVEKLAEYLK
jgi:hypothetical protein